MICRLCQEDKTLIKKSHIIPKFLYKGILLKGKKIHQINLNNFNEQKSTFPDGIYDKYILCANCDNHIIGQYESYAGAAFYYLKDNSSSRQTIQVEIIDGADGLKSVFFRNIDYTKFKLFLLSILWRADISTNKFFNNVSLGVHSERIRKMILNGHAGSKDEYETSLLYIDSLHVPAKSILNPLKLRDSGNTSYIFHINNIMYFFNISGFNKSPLIVKGRIEPDNTMRLPILDGSIAINFFDDFLGRKFRSKSGKFNNPI